LIAGETHHVNPEKSCKSCLINSRKLDT
jgi:hypothetical protein